MLFRGIGGYWSPHAPDVEALISDRLAVRGHAGVRRVGRCLFGSTSKSHALEYAKDECEDALHVLEPQIGTVISWAPNVRDMIITFEQHLSDLRYRKVEKLDDVRVGALIRDIAGCSSIANTYLAYGRQKRALTAIVDHFLNKIEIKEFEVLRSRPLDQLLDGHNGEVWITGPCFVKPYDPTVHQEFEWIASAAPSMSG